MKPEELFGVVVRSVGLIILVLGLGMIVTDVAETVGLPPGVKYANFGERASIEGLFFVLLGIVFLFKTKWVVGLVYRSGH